MIFFFFFIKRLGHFNRIIHSDNDEISDLSDSTSESVSEESDDDDDDDLSSSLHNTTPQIASISSDGNGANSLDTCVETLRDVIGDIGDAALMRLALAADNDSARAVNFYFNENQLN